MSNWIKCSERLPEMYQQCLVCLIGSDDKIHMTVAHYNGDKNKFLGVNRWRISATHWQPLPEPPGDEE